MDHNVRGILPFYLLWNTLVILWMDKPSSPITSGGFRIETLCIENVFSFFYGIKTQKRYPVIHIAVDRRCAKNDYGIGTLGVAS